MDNVILRKRRPSKREGLPTKDLCILRVPHVSRLSRRGRAGPQSKRRGLTHARAPGWPTFTFFCKSGNDEVGGSRRINQSVG